MKFIKFGIVGSLGALTNIVLFYLFVDLLEFNKFIIATLNFLICVTQNYILNHFWTFHEITHSEKLSLARYIKFILTSLIGYIINISVLKFLPYFLDLPFDTIAQLIGILSGMIFNFLGSYIFVFIKKKQIIINNIAD
jgi:putative flippase GtrA